MRPLRAWLLRLWGVFVPPAMGNSPRRSKRTLKCTCVI